MTASEVRKGSVSLSNLERKPLFGKQAKLIHKYELLILKIDRIGRSSIDVGSWDMRKITPHFKKNGFTCTKHFICWRK